MLTSSIVGLLITAMQCSLATSRTPWQYCPDVEILREPCQPGFPAQSGPGFLAALTAATHEAATGCELLFRLLNWG